MASEYFNKYGIMLKNVFFIIILVLFSCNSKENGTKIPVFDNDSFQVISIDPSKTDTKFTDIYQFVDTIEFIPLETDDNFLIGNVRKVCVWNNSYYIWDEITASIFCFDRNGRYRFKIAKKGLGPGEYPGIDDFALDRNTGDIYIYSSRLQAILGYDKDGTFKEKHPCPLITSSIESAGRDTFLCYSGRLPNMFFYQAEFPNQYRYTVLHKEQSILKGLYCKYNEDFMKLPISHNEFTSYNDSTLLVETMNGKVFTIDKNNGLNPRYQINIESNKYKFSFEEDNIASILESYKNNDYANFNRMEETSKYIFIRYSYKGFYMTSIFDKESNIIFSTDLFWMDNRNEMAFEADFMAVDGDNLIAIEESHILKTTLGKKLKKSIHIDESDNPIIIKYRLKNVE